MADMATMTELLTHEAEESARQRMVARYGLSGPQAWQYADPQLRRILREVCRELQSRHCTINILDEKRMWTLHGDEHEPVSVSARCFSMCHRVLETLSASDLFVTEDASQVRFLADSPWVNGEAARMRFYAAAPLVARGGYVLGTVCAVSPDVGTLSDAERSALLRARDLVLEVLEARRLLRSVPGSPDSTLGPSPANGGGKASETRSGRAEAPTWTIDAVIDDRAVQTVFQPVVHLASGAVVGFEALSRGPIGSPLEQPAALLTAARDAGRLGELDWLCRTHAMQAAAAADLHPSLSWLINVEPAGLAIECPDHLRTALERARTELRVILEIVERDVEGHVTALLHATDQARRDSWGVALDDVGAEESSLALLPFLRPDVVKLDLRLVQSMPEQETASITAAVRAYAERTGAVILAEGIETEAHERLARVFGATYGQGYRYGRPGPLPTTVPAPRNLIPLRQRLTPLADATPFEMLTASMTPQRASQSDLRHISQHLEHKSASLDEACVLLSTWPPPGGDHGGQPQPGNPSRTNALTVILAEDATPQSEPRFQITRPRPRSRISREWITIISSAHYAAAFVGRSCGQPRAGADHEYDYVYTHDRNAVVSAARSFLQELGSQARAD
ncbi:MAG: hypothetical protein JWO63_1005 [Frankiales bacterium]|nr:hypothetical protein [Frankiales bacterium]